MPESLFDFAWAAGFFDGEGHVGFHKQRKYRTVRASITQLDRRVLDKFQRIVGIGHVSGPHKNGSGERPRYYHYTAQGFNAVYALYGVLAPYLSEIKDTAFQSSLSNMLEYKDGARERWYMARGLPYAK